MADLSNDIARYHRGELTPAEMHALEKRALTDPFLADALEGTSDMSPADMEADLAELAKSLQQRTTNSERTAKTITFWTWPARIAAAVVLLAVAGGIAYITLRDNQSDKLAMHSEQAATPEPATEAPATTEETPGATPQAMQPKPAPADATQAREDVAPPPVVAESRVREEVSAQASEPAQGIAATPEPAEAEAEASGSAAEGFALSDEKNKADALYDIAPDSMSLAQHDRQAKEIADAPARMRAKKAAPAPATSTTEGLASTAKPAAQKLVSGTVTNEDGQPLPGVNVVIKGSSTGTVTNADGQYRLTTPDNATLSFSFIGFTSVDVPTTSGKVDVALNTDVSELSEVVVTGYSIDRDDGLGEAVVELATPAGGKKAFKQYLENNLVYPQQAIEHKVEGRVTITFTVEPTGALTDFKVVRGIGYGCEDELIRLVQSGPKWIPTKRNREPVTGEVRVRMKFELPRKK